MLDNAGKMSSTLPLTFLTLLLCSALSTASLQTLPAFLWGSGDAFLQTGRQSGIQALYQVSTSGAFAADILSSGRDDRNGGQNSLLNLTALQPHNQRLVTVFVLGELGRSDLSRGQGIAASLTKAIGKAISSVFISDLEATHGQLIEDVKSQSQAFIELGDCDVGAQSPSLDALQSELGKHPGRLTVLICNSKAADLFERLEEELATAKRPFLVVYAGQPEEASARPAARYLMATSPSNEKDLCDRKCRIQVRLFEVIILLIFLLVALYAGLSMLHILDTPTRFEQEKKEVNRHHD